MAFESAGLPVIDRPDATVALVEVVAVDDRDVQRAATDAISAHWRSGAWPADLVSLSCYASTDGAWVLTYAQWSSDAAMRDSLRQEKGVSRGGPVWESVGARPTGAVPFRLYRVVRGGAVTEADPLPECFPAAVFPMGGEEAARGWIDGLLASEEETEGADRDYPGAIAANFHIGLDDGSVLVLSEWVSEKEAADHIQEVIQPLLDQAGGGDPGALYAHCLTLEAPEIHGA
ncbi:hypothetical protein ACIGJO_05705 [Streptomyces sp. NPDC079020]|uniref:hypothetical protein n=1 Tax=Streptomyces sp. NPDC079020 TaxID=3365722 RepID=UPI0037D8BFE9